MVRALALITLSFLFYQSCKTTSSSSGLDRETGDFADKVSEIGTLWQVVNRQEYLNKITKPNQTTVLLPADNAKVMILNDWAKTIDQKLRTLYPEKLKNIPSPKVEVVEKDKWNAYVGGIPVCVEGVTVTLEENFEGPWKELYQVFMMAMFPDQSSQRSAARTASIVLAPGKIKTSRSSCITRRKLSQKELQEIIDFYTQYTNGVCELTAVSATQVKAVGMCNLEENTYSLQYYATMDTVTFYSGLVSKSTPEEIFGVLAHELGHYYNGHIPLGFDSKFQRIFSSENHWSDPNKPFLPSETENNLSERLYQVKIGTTYTDNVNRQALKKWYNTAIRKDSKIPLPKKGVYTPNLIGPLLAMVYQYECRAAINYWQSAQDLRASIESGFKNYTQKASDQYTKLWAQAKPCLSSIKYGNSKTFSEFFQQTIMIAGISQAPYIEEEDTPEKDELMGKSLYDILYAAQTAMSLRLQNVSFVSYEEGANSFSVSSYFDPAKREQISSIINEDMLKKIDSVDGWQLNAEGNFAYKAAQLLEKKRIILDEIKSKRYGVYNKEQEADEVAIEILNHFKVPSENFANLWLKLGKGKCADYDYKNKAWLKTPVWGDPTIDPHPAICYRAYSALQESKLHNTSITSQGESSSIDFSRWTESAPTPAQTIDDSLSDPSIVTLTPPDVAIEYCQMHPIEI